jgi:hypothetical protein
MDATSHAAFAFSPTTPPTLSLLVVQLFETSISWEFSRILGDLTEPEPHIEVSSAMVTVSAIVSVGRSPGRPPAAFPLAESMIRSETLFPTIVMTPVIGAPVAEDRIVAMMSEMKLEPGEEPAMVVVRTVIISEVITTIPAVTKEMIGKQI